MSYRLLPLSLILLLVSETGLAQAAKFSSGTGFFVSRKGEIVTNAHVVEPCGRGGKVMFTGPNRKPREATIVAYDRQKDLALLETHFRPNRIATLRWMHTKIQEQADVFLIGYPQAESINSPYRTARAKIKALQGPFGEAQWLQFTDSARQGNSGGPLLDYAGNVVGVVTAKSKVMRLNQLSARKEVVEESDVAVTAKVLKGFLDRHYVHYNQNDAVVTLSENRLEQTARDYVVHIFCRVQGNG